MTKPQRGPSLPQARTYNSDGNSNSNHHHFHTHNRSPQHHVEDRQIPDVVDSLVTRVIQTVSLIQVVDSAGSPLEIHTHYAPPSTIIVDSITGITIDSADLDPASILPTPEPLPIPVPDLSLDDPAQSTVAPTATTPSEPLTSQDGVLTSTPSSTPPFPSFAVPVNSTNAPFNSSLFTNSSLIRPFGVSSSTSSSSSTSAISSTTTILTSTSLAPLSTSVDDAGGGSGDPGGGASGPPAPNPDPSGAGPSPTPVPTQAVVGGVVGGLAGVALLVVLVLFALKWKKRNQDKLLLGDDSALTGRSLFSRAGPPDGNTGGAGGMVQRSLTFGAAAAAVVKGASHKNQEPAETGERGFYRVSGRKLPSVLQSGGDGYTDPRGSVMTTESVDFRESHSFFDAGRANAPPRLALGSPMRPVSGIPVMRSGPARTPVTETGPFADPESPLQPPFRDPIGRSLTSQDGSRGSGSRFAEDM